MPKIIAIEGIDGVGKSTLASNIEHVLKNANACVIKTPSGIGKELVERTGNTPGLQTFFSYLIANVTLLAENQDNEWLILDRYILSTLVYHQEHLEVINDLLPGIIKSFCVKPDYTIYLAAEMDIISNRLADRKAPSRHALSSRELLSRYDSWMQASGSEHYLGKLLHLPSNSAKNLASNVEIIRDILGI